LKRISDSGCHVLISADENYPPLAEADLRSADSPLRPRRTHRPRQKRRRHGRLPQTTHYGIEIARKLGYQLACTGVTVVSGGARGIDTASHQGRLSAKAAPSRCSAPASIWFFPPRTPNLFERIALQGAVITQFPFNRPADKQSFPIRNRIVAGMTLGTVVVEANLTSGALITAGMAVEYGRQVFAVPGRIDSPRSKGCHDLIKKGAKLCEGVEDILSEFEYLFPSSNRPPSPGETGILPALELSANEQKVFDALKTDDELTIDEVIRASGLPSSAVSVSLLSLEMKRVVKQLPGKLFVRNN
jgi:DNA processing protein